MRQVADAQSVSHRAKEVVLTAAAGHQEFRLYRRAIGACAALRALDNIAGEVKQPQNPLPERKLLRQFAAGKLGVG